MMLIPMALGMVGLICLLFKRTLLGMIIGIQLLNFGAASAFIVAAVKSSTQATGHIFGFFIVLSGIVQLILLYSAAIRLFYLKKQIGVENIRSLRS